ncbi:LytR/AlgR family response regulator transcription factor [Paraglaciecola arctica]|uniref:Two-component system, LytT family, response regulator LytT n=1 Tax=Paraglaciecola arctica BSs20135 TaxID=493475 RepID=K6Z2H4_9ALTE|nr:LytTR family DNA-binding domain-containing protein [Paraglaciecola arctica]GAC17660.1 two-component system, LytT family, response regulator LytT [Paraglaciecola arctica BSs20135]
MTFKALLVDDERLARQELRELLAEFSDVRIIGEAKNLTEAVDLIKDKKPDIVFLDIQLRQENGFDLLEKVVHNFNLIFVTAFDEFAIRAFEINALDYLLKPVNPKRLKASIDKLYQENAEPVLAVQKLNIDDPIFLNLGDHSHFLQISKISHICASGDYTEVFTISGAAGGNALLVEKSLKEWEDRLPEKSFVRIHRSTIINISQIDSIEVLPNRTMEVSLKNSPKIFTVSRRYASKFKQQFG